MPCSNEELKSIGYSSKMNSNPSLQTMAIPSGRSIVGKKPKTFLPNLTQMVPFKPKQNPGIFYEIQFKIDYCFLFLVNNLMPGGIFPYPPAIVSLLSQIPPPVCFRGPFVNIDELISIFQTNTNISLNDFNKADSLLSTDAKSYFSLALEVSESFSSHTGTKRGLPFDDEDEMDGEGSNLMPPQFDIYRTRQLQKKPRI